MKIRAAVITDVPKIRLLEKQLIAHERTVIATIKDGEDVRYQDIGGLIADKENTMLLVMEDDGEIIGCGFGQVRTNAEYYKQAYFGYIGMMSIDKEHRGNGYGGEIIKELLAWFKTKNIAEVQLKVFTNNNGAVKAYNKLGFEAYSTDMMLEI